MGFFLYPLLLVTLLLPLLHFSCSKGNEKKAKKKDEANNQVSPVPDLPDIPMAPTQAPTPVLRFSLREAESPAPAKTSGATPMAESQETERELRQPKSGDKKTPSDDKLLCEDKTQISLGRTSRKNSALKSIRSVSEKSSKKRSSKICSKP